MAAAPHHAGRWLLLLLLAVLAASPAAAADEQPGPSSSMAADASRLSLPGHPKLTLVYPLAGLRAPPTPNPAYGAPASPSHPMSNASVAFAGGRGWLVITRHEMSAAPGGVLSEAMFFPGQYVPLRCAPPGWTAAQPRPRYHSTARFWVDWSVSRDFGRNVWGFPKEMASFKWTDTSVSITAGGRQIFNASFTGRVLSKAASGSSNTSGLERWMAAVVGQGINTIAWPISVAATAAGATAPPSDMPAVTLEASSTVVTETAPEAAAAVAAIPNTQPLAFKAQGYTITSLSTLEPGRIEFDAQAFTGRRSGGAGNRLALASGLGVGLIAGSPGMFGSPVKLQCSAAVLG